MDYKNFKYFDLLRTIKDDICKANPDIFEINDDIVVLKKEVIESFCDESFGETVLSDEYIVKHECEPIDEAMRRVKNYFLDNHKVRNKHLVEDLVSFLADGLYFRMEKYGSNCVITHFDIKKSKNFDNHFRLYVHVTDSSTGISDDFYCYYREFIMFLKIENGMLICHNDNDKYPRILQSYLCEDQTYINSLWCVFNDNYKKDKSFYPNKIIAWFDGRMGKSFFNKNIKYDFKYTQIRFGCFSHVHDITFDAKNNYLNSIQKMTIINKDFSEFRFCFYENEPKCDIKGGDKLPSFVSYYPETGKIKKEVWDGIKIRQELPSTIMYDPTGEEILHKWSCGRADGPSVYVCDKYKNKLDQLRQSNEETFNKIIEIFNEAQGNEKVKKQAYDKKLWLFKGKFIPDSVPRIENNSFVNGIPSDSDIIDVMLNFDREYGSFIKKKKEELLNNSA